MPWQPSERAGRARQHSSQGCGYWKSYASSKRWLPRSTGCKHRAIGKGWAHRAQPKPVATWDHIETITTSRGHWAWGRLVFLAICSIVYL